MEGRFTRTVRRWTDVFFDRLRIRPGGLIVFVLSVVALAVVNSRSIGRTQAPAVGYAVVSHHPSPVASVIEEVYVHPGDEVETGAPLLTLSSRFLDRQLALVDAEIQRVTNEARLEQTELEQQVSERAGDLGLALSKARRDHRRAQALSARQKALTNEAEKQLDEVAQRVQSGVAPVDELLAARWSLESERTGSSEASSLAQAESALVGELARALGPMSKTSPLAEPMRAAHQAELESLLAQRRALVEDLGALTVAARSTGRVLSVLAPGAAVAQDLSVAEVLPDRASEIVAYVPADGDVRGISTGDEVRLARVCPGPAKVLRRGAAVQEAPLQLSNVLGRPIYGTPVYIEVPPDCSLGVGQILSVGLALDRW
jgi:multidrug resistance efflux pump